MQEYANSKLWRVDRVQGVELFISPEGVSYRRTDETRATCVLRFDKLPPLWLREESADRLTRVAARKQRRLERRENARIKRGRK